MVGFDFGVTGATNARYRITAFVVSVFFFEIHGVAYSYLLGDFVKVLILILEDDVKNDCVIYDNWRGKSAVKRAHDHFERGSAKYEREGYSVKQEPENREAH